MTGRRQERGRAGGVGEGPVNRKVPPGPSGSSGQKSLDGLSPLLQERALCPCQGHHRVTGTGQDPERGAEGPGSHPGASQ